MTTQQTKEALRNTIRAAIFGADNMKPKSVEATLAGQAVEIRQPKLGDIIDMGDDEKGLTIAVMLVRYTYVPNSDIQIFDMGDVDMIKAMPFGSDIQKLMEVITKLTEIEVVTNEKK